MQELINAGAYITWVEGNGLEMVAKSKREVSDLIIMFLAV